LKNYFKVIDYLYDNITTYQKARPNYTWYDPIGKITKRSDGTLYTGLIFLPTTRPEGTSGG